MTDVEWIAYGKNSLTDLELGSVAQNGGGQSFSFHLQKREISLYVFAPQFGLKCTAVGQCYAQIGDAVNHVVICQNVSMLGDNNAAAQCFHVRLGIAVPVDADCIGRMRSCGLPCEDVHHRGRSAFDGTAEVTLATDS